MGSEEGSCLLLLIRDNNFLDLLSMAMQFGGCWGSLSESPFPFNEPFLLNFICLYHPPSFSVVFRAILIENVSEFMGNDPLNKFVENNLKLYFIFDTANRVLFWLDMYKRMILPKICDNHTGCCLLVGQKSIHCWYTFLPCIYFCRNRLNRNSSFYIILHL